MKAPPRRPLFRGAKAMLAAPDDADDILYIRHMANRQETLLERQQMASPRARRLPGHRLANVKCL